MKYPTIEMTPLNVQLLGRFAQGGQETHENGINWLANKKLTQVTTKTAFQLAKGGREVWGVDADGTDYLIDDIELHSEYYPDKTKTWPEIETIFLVEGVL